MRIQQIRNATLKIEYADKMFLIDPWLQDKGTGFSARAVREEMSGVRCPMNDLPFSVDEVLSGVDFCLVTHIHPDHFAEDYLPKDMQLIVQNKADEEKVRELGFMNVIAFGTDAISVGNVRITKVPALHGANEAAVQKMGEASGFIIQGEDKIVYIAGDTVYYEGVEQTILAYRPDVIALNCCEATVPLGRLIMNLEDVEKVCRKAPDALVIATHLDSVNHALVTSGDVRVFAQKKKLKNLCVPANGEWVHNPFVR